MNNEIFDIVREAITIAKVQRINSIPKLRAKLLEREYSPDDIQGALEIIIKSRDYPILQGTYND